MIIDPNRVAEEKEEAEGKEEGAEEDEAKSGSEDGEKGNGSISSLAPSRSTEGPGSPSSPITSPSMGKKVSHHPLSQDGESPWTQFFQDAELSKTIESDVQRTFPDESYFRPAHIQERLVRILLIYCKLHEDISYRQGMHELAALILRVVDEDATAVSQKDDSLTPEDS